MGIRRKARECALQILFQADVNGEAPDLASYFQHHHASAQIRSFVERLVKGCGEHAADIDRAIASHSTNWSVDRMGAVERNVLRIGAFELLYEWTTPPKVIMDEAIEIARKFGSTESTAFINGVLDAISKAAHDERMAGERTK